jgi:hypothetical protein
MSASLSETLFVVTHLTSYQILGSSRALTSFLSFRTMRSVIIFRHFFASLRASQILLLHSFLFTHWRTSLGCSPAAAIHRGRSKQFVISSDTSSRELTKPSKTMLPEPEHCGRDGRLTPRWSQRRLRLEFMNGLSYTTITEIAESLARRRGSALMSVVKWSLLDSWS